MRRALVLLAAVSLLAGCGGSAPPPDEPVPTPFADCATVGQAGPVRPSPDAPSIPIGKTRLPTLELACMTGDRKVDLAALRGPLVVNLWASWCGPCRTELPAMQRVADAGRVPVLGVVTGDARDNASWLGDDLKIGMPTLYDKAGRLQAELGVNGLPLTLFVAADGSVAVHTGPALTDDSLAALIEQHFGAAA